MTNRLIIKLADGLYIDLSKARSHKYISRKPDGKGGWIYTYYKKPVGNSYAVNYNDMRDFDYEKAVQIYKDTESIRNIKNYEHSKIYDNKGIVLLYKIFPKTGGSFTNEELNKIENSKLLIHNHPSGDSFSTKDIQLIIEKNINEIRAIGQKEKTKTIFSLKLEKQIPIELKRDLLNYHFSLWNINKTTGDKFFAHKTMQDFIKVYGEYFKYERIK